MKVSIVIPSYNGWDRLPVLCWEIIRIFEDSDSLGDFEIIIADDGSRIRSSNLIEELKNKAVDVKGVFLKRNYGQQLATLAGLFVSSGDFVFTVDDDLSHNPVYFASMIELLKKGKFDIVFGIPEEKTEGYFRRFGSKSRDIIFAIFFRRPRGIYVSSFRLLSRELINKIILDISEYRYLSVEILKYAKKIANIKVHVDTDPENISRYGFLQLVFLAFSLIRCSRLFPLVLRRSKAASEMEWYII